MPREHVLPNKRTMGIRIMCAALPKKVSEYFPYETVRPYQNQFIETVANAVENRRSVLIEGSNGLGKTISALLSQRLLGTIHRKL